MNQVMLSASKNHEVLNAVIRFIVVNVMNNLIAFKRDARCFFNYKAMFPYIFVIYSKVDISPSYYASSAWRFLYTGLPTISARKRTECSSIFYPIWPNFKFLFASLAIQYHHDPIVSF